MKDKFDGKFVEETVILTFDFAKLLATGETILIAEWDVAVAAGADPTPNNTKSGVASITGSKISQKITAGVSGVTYTHEAKATTSLGQVLVLRADLDVLS